MKSKKIKRLPKGARFVRQDGYSKKNHIAKYFATDKNGNAIGYGLLYVHNLRDARKQLLAELNSGVL